MDAPCPYNNKNYAIHWPKTSINWANTFHTSKHRWGLALELWETISCWKESIFEWWQYCCEFICQMISYNLYPNCVVSCRKGWSYTRHLFGWALWCIGGWEWGKGGLIDSLAGSTKEGLYNEKDKYCDIFDMDCMRLWNVGRSTKQQLSATKINEMLTHTILGKSKLQAVLSLYSQ